MNDSPDDQELLEELAPFLHSARSGEDPGTIPPEDLTRRILSEHSSGRAAGNAPPESLPRPFGPYELRSVLGRGGSATVYAGFDPELQREIAIKILAPELAAIDTARERFLQEAQAAAKLHHDHIMPIFAVHQDTPLPCLTMPLLEGRTLQARLDAEGALPSAEVSRIGAELAAALHAAHDAGYVHRDVKPSNVFLEAGSGRAKLMDFGLAKAEGAVGLTQPGVLAGTPEYLAPEQLDGIDPSHASDLYGLGGTLYATAAGIPPFTGPSITSVLKKIASDPPPPLPEATAGPLRHLITALLEKDPAKRPSSAGEVQRMLEDGDESRQDSPPRSWRSHAAIAALVVVALVGVQQVLKNSDGDGTPSASSGTVEAADLAGLRAALLREGESPLSIRITTPGTYILPPLDLGTRDVTIEAGQAGTTMQWMAGSEPNLRSEGTLVLRNLILHQEVPSGLSSPAALLEFRGPELRLESCRLSQTRSARSRVGRSYFLTVHSAGRVTIHRTLAHLFISSLLELQDPGGDVRISESLAFVPRILTSRAGGTAQFTDSGLVSHFGVSVEGGPPALAVRAERCYLQSSYSPLWLPGVRTGAETTARVTWSGEGNVYSAPWLFLFTSTSPPFGRAPRGTPPEFHWTAFSDWVSHWKDSESGSRQVPRPLVWPSGSGQPGTVSTEEISEQFLKVLSEGVAIDPSKTGPFGE